MLTDNDVLVRNLPELPALMCVQRKAEKRVPTEADTIASNIASFGDDIGKTTNWITSMFDVRAQFAPDSEEWKILDYRIKCGQLYQQNAIDKAKGILCKPMPKEWHDRHAIAKIEDEEKRDLYFRIAAEKKPYFMRYIYPALMKKYNQYVKNTGRKCVRLFGITIDELNAIPAGELTEAQSEMLYYYNKLMPTSNLDGVMNRICRRFESEFDRYITKSSKQMKFDPAILKSGIEYNKSTYNQINKIYTKYKSDLRYYMMSVSKEHIDEYDAMEKYAILRNSYDEACAEICPDSITLCDIVVDMCYKKSESRPFVWDVCRDELINNLLVSRDYTISYPTKDPDGDIEFGGERFSMRTARLGVYYGFGDE